MKPTPYEVYIVAQMLYKNQGGHPSNWNSFDSFIPIAIENMKEVSDEIDKVFKNKGETK